jgi:hypothetical protein
MTDQTNTASGDLSLPGAAPSAPAVPQMSAAQAASMKQEFFADKAKMDALMAGDVNATAEWRNIVNAISAQPAAPMDSREAAADALQESAGLRCTRTCWRSLKTTLRSRRLNGTLRRRSGTN